MQVVGQCRQVQAEKGAPADRNEVSRIHFFQTMASTVEILDYIFRSSILSRITVRMQTMIFVGI